MKRIKLGHINYVNSYPLYYTILKERQDLPFDLVSDVPAKLNALMREGKLDLSLISSYEYARSPEHYLIYGPFCLASTGYVNSVLLISKKDLADLNGARIGLTTSSATSSNLIKILLGKFYGFKNTFNPVSFSNGGALPLSTNDAVLIIGDEALQFADTGDYLVYDIGNVWAEKTGHPVVFALLAINLHSARNHRKELDTVFKKINESYETFREHPGLIAAFAEAHSTLPVNFTQYFSSLEYSFTEDLREGLRYYFRMLYRCGLASQAATMRFY